MALPYDIDTKRRVVTITVPSASRVGDASGLLEAVIADARYEPGFAFLIDRRAVRTPPHPDDVRATLDVVRRQGAALSGARWAIVVSDDVAAASGTLALSDALTALGAGFEVRAFLVLADALRWLGLGEP